jgi:hypothetical protein
MTRKQYPMTLRAQTITECRPRPPLVHRLEPPPSAARQACEEARIEWQRRHRQIALRVRKQAATEGPDHA